MEKHMGDGVYLNTEFIPICLLKLMFPFPAVFVVVGRR